MEFTEKVNDRSRIEGINTNVEIEVEQIGGSSSRGLEVTERIETAVKEEIKAIADEKDAE